MPRLTALLLGALALAAALPEPAAAQSSAFQSASGFSLGVGSARRMAEPAQPPSQTQSQDMTQHYYTLRDSSGRPVGSAEPLHSGLWVERDLYGRRLGTWETGVGSELIQRDATGRRSAILERKF